MKTYKYHYVYTITNPTILDENNKPKVSVGVRCTDVEPKEDDFYGTPKVIKGTPTDKLVKDIISVWDNKLEATKHKMQIYCELNKTYLAEKRKEYYSNHIDKVVEYNKENKEKISKRSKQYRQDNKAELYAKEKIYKEKNKDKIAVKRKKYYVSHKEEASEKYAEYLNKNRDKINTRKSEYRNSKAGKQVEEEYRKNNKTLIKLSGQNNRNNKLLKAASDKITNGNNGDDWIFYTLQFTHTSSNKIFYKYGVTGKSVELRFCKGYSQFTYKILDVVYGDEQYVKALERKHLLASKQYNHVFSNKSEFGGGYTECRTHLVESIEI